MKGRIDRALMHPALRASADNIDAAHRLAVEGRLGPGLSVTCRGKVDGTGSQAMSIISAMVVARHLGCRYLHSSFATMKHGGADRQDWAARWERFLNFGDGEERVPEDADVIRLAELVKNPDAYRGRSIVVAEKRFVFLGADTARVLDTLRTDLRAKYWRSDKSAVPLHRELPGGVNVAVHVRRGDIREGNRRYVKDNAVLQSIKRVRWALAPLGRPVQINIYSEGIPEDFRVYQDLGCRLQIGVDTFETFHNMVVADIFVQGRSTFSGIAGLLSEGIVIAPKKWPDSLPDWQFPRAGGELSIQRLRKALLRPLGWRDRWAYRARRLHRWAGRRWSAKNG
jgi:hypothetical protein